MAKETDASNASHPTEVAALARERAPLRRLVRAARSSHRSRSAPRRWRRADVGTGWRNARRWAEQKAPAGCGCPDAAGGQQFGSSIVDGSHAAFPSTDKRVAEMKRNELVRERDMEMLGLGHPRAREDAGRDRRVVPERPRTRCAPMHGHRRCAFGTRRRIQGEARLRPEGLRPSSRIERRAQDRLSRRTATVRRSAADALVIREWA